MMESVEFEALIGSFGRHDSEEKELKKICDDEKSKIKEIMKSNAIDRASGGGFNVTYSTSTSESMDNAKAMSILKSYWKEEHGDEPCPYIKTIEVLDERTVESALYNKSLPDKTLAALSGCITTKVIETLRCSRAK